ncbi:uncharacterized protein LOC144320087 [Canis aureus]
MELWFKFPFTGCGLTGLWSYSPSPEGTVYVQKLSGPRNFLTWEFPKMIHSSTCETRTKLSHFKTKQVDRSAGQRSEVAPNAKRAKRLMLFNAASKSSNAGVSQSYSDL